MSEHNVYLNAYKTIISRKAKMSKNLECRECHLSVWNNSLSSSRDPKNYNIDQKGKNLHHYVFAIVYRLD